MKTFSSHRFHKFLLPARNLVAALVLSCSAAPLSGATIWDSAIANYRFADNLNDSNGSNHGTGRQEGVEGSVAGSFVSVGSSTLPGWNETALSLASMRYVDLGQGASDALQLTGSFTLFARVNMTVDGSSVAVISKDGTAGNRSFALRLSNLSTTPELSIRLNGNKVVTGTSSGLGLNKWVDIAVVFESGVRITLYINGVAVTNETSGVPSSVLNNSTTPLLIGAQPFPSPNSTTPDIDNPFTGYINGIAIWNRALGNEEVMSLTTIPEPGTIGLLFLSTAGFLGWARSSKRLKAAGGI